MRRVLIASALLALATQIAQAATDNAGSARDGEVVLSGVEARAAAFDVVRVVDDLEHPWAVDWLPDGRMLITERGGTLVLIDGDRRSELDNVPQVWAENQGGLLDIAVSPDYRETGWIYLTHSRQDDAGKGGTVLTRARLDGSRLTDVEELYRQTPFLETNYHFGSRIAFLDDGTLVVAMGERGERREQTLDLPSAETSVGATVRLNRDGSIPDDNPFVGTDKGLPEVFSYGHRNPQGMAIHPETGAIWQHEHGPHGGDELNLIEAGNNYGWPAVSYGDTYATQSPIGGETAPGVTDPVEYWDPSPAFSGMAFYTGAAVPAWRHNLFMGALAQQKILRVELGDNNQVVDQEELLRGEIGRIRDVAMGPEGRLYFLTDSPSGGLYRVEPVATDGE